MKNTAIGNHAGPVGSITTSRRDPAGVPANAATSISVRLSTVGNALRFTNVTPSPSRTRTACADAIPKSMPTNRRSLTSPSPGSPLLSPARSRSDAMFGHGPKGRLSAAPTHVL